MGGVRVAGTRAVMRGFLARSPPQKLKNRCPAAWRGAATRTHEKHIEDAHGRGASGRYSCGETMLPSQIAPRPHSQNVDAVPGGGGLT